MTTRHDRRRRRRDRYRHGRNNCHRCRRGFGRIGDRSCRHNNERGIGESRGSLIQTSARYRAARCSAATAGHTPGYSCVARVLYGSGELLLSARHNLSRRG